MSVQAIGWVFDHSRSEGTARLVLIGIANACDRDGRHAWPSHDRVGRDAACSRWAVQRAVTELEKLGELARVEIPGKRRGGRSRYVYWLPLMTSSRGLDGYDDEIAERFGLPPIPVRGATAPTGTEPVRGGGAPTGEASTGRTRTAVRGAGAPNPPPAPIVQSLEPSLEPSNARASDHDPFDIFWELYPRRVAKLAARRAWDRRIKQGADPEAIIRGAAAYAGWVEATGAGPYVKHPATWLNGGCETDQLPDPGITRRDDRGTAVDAVRAFAREASK